MTGHIALLRGINVGGHHQVPMADLRVLIGELGFTEVKSLLQSGNLVFRSDGPGGRALEALLEKATAKRFGFSIDYMVRSAAEWGRLVERNPFPKEAKSDPSRLLVMFLKTAPPARSVDALQAAIQGPEILRCDGKQLYLVYPAGIGRSKLTGTVIEKKLASRGTARNWNTVLKIAALCEPLRSR